METVAGHPTTVLGGGDDDLLVVPGFGDVLRRDSLLTEAFLRYYYDGFADDYTVHLVGRPSVGEDATTRGMAEGYARVLDEIGGADVLGVSLGGLVAQYIAADHPERVGRVVVGVAGYRLGDEGRRRVEGWRDSAAGGDWQAAYTDAVETVYSGGFRRRLYGAMARMPVEV